VEVVALKNQIPNVEIHFQRHPSPRIPKFIFAIAGSGFGFEGLEAATIGQVVREDLMTVKAKASSSKDAQKRRITTSTPPTTISPLNTPPGNGSRLTFPLGEEPQGPLLMDNDLELDVELPLDMVAVMQEGVAKKARKMVIERTIRNKSTIKVLNDCLKLHLLTSFVSATVLTRGFFEALFLDEEGAKTTRKITSVEWSDMNCFFSKYVLNFDSNAQGVEAMLTHTVKV
jgi:hypothetical protein